MGDHALFHGARRSNFGFDMIRYNMIYLLTAIGLTPGGSSTVHIYTQIIHRTSQLTTLVGRLSGIRAQSKKVNQSHYRPDVPRGFQEVKVPRLRNNGPGWW